MRKAGKIIIDASTKNSDLLYKVGVIVPDPFIYFCVADKDYVVVKSLEYARVKQFAKENITTLLPETVTGSDKNISDKDVIKAVINKFEIGTFEVPKNFPVFYADYIRSLNVKISVEEGDFFPEREVKTKAELDKIREAVRTVEKCMRRVETIIREATVNGDDLLEYKGEILTSEMLHTEVDFEAVRNSATAADTIIASGKDGSQPHNAGSGPIKTGTPIVVDIFPRMNKTGYCGDMTRTFVKGKAPEIVKKAYDAVYRAKEEAKKAIRNGVSAAAIHKISIDIIEESGFETGCKDGDYFGFFHSLGHGVGLDVHEAPLLSTKVDKPLKKNSVVTVEPGVYYKEWGGVRLEDMVIVNDNGIECLTNYPEVLEID